MKKRFWENILIALSLANLLLIISWRRLIYPNSPVYNIKFTPTYLDYLSTMLMVLLVAGILFGGLLLVRKILKEKATFVIRLGFLFILLCIANAVRMAVPKQQLWLMNNLGIPLLLTICGVAGLIGLILLIKYWDKSFAVLRLFILILSPFVMITFFNAGKAILFSAEDLPNSIEFKSSDKKSTDKTDIKSRVIWIIFDELEYKTLFENRPADVKMPEFDRLKNESLMATKAISPGYQTLQSVPSLLVGKKVKEAIPYGQSQLVLNFADGQNQRKLSETPNVFSDVRDLGGESAAVGWYHAYCRVFQKELSACHWESFDFGNDFRSESFSQAFRRDLYNLVTTVPLVIRYFKRFETDEYLERHERLLTETLDVIKNPDIDLAFIHLPIPHNPYRYNKETDDFSGGDYLDNLVLTDEVLGKIRQTLERENLWDESVVIVSSDHQWRLEQLKFSLTEREVKLTNRDEDERIPFFVKMKSQTEAYEFNKRFSTVISRELISEIMQGKLSTGAEVKAWLEENAGK